jgi:hypothetical protein
MVQWLLGLRGGAVQASTPVSVLHGRSRLEPLEHLRQLPLEQLKFGDLLSHGLQLLGHEGVQSGPHGQTCPVVKLRRQRCERGEGEP